MLLLLLFFCLRTTKVSTSYIAPIVDFGGNVSGSEFRLSGALCNGIFKIVFFFDNPRSFLNSRGIIAGNISVHITVFVLFDFVFVLLLLM